MSVGTHVLRELKETIESMSNHHQIEVLRILHDKNTSLNENQNGTFVIADSFNISKSIKPLGPKISFLHLCSAIII